MMKYGVCLTVVLAALACGGGCGNPKPTETVAAEPVQGLEPVAAAAKQGINFQAAIEQAKTKVFPTLVYIKPIQEDFSEGKKRRVVVAGSGVIISPDGYVITNHHVAEKAVEIRCVLYDNTMLNAELVGIDKDTDLALLKLKPTNPLTKFPCATLADSDKVEEGQFVMALGAPWGLKRSISLGIVSCAQRFLEGSSEYSLWLQSDAALNPGNSGGPLIDTDGQVIGINTMGSLYGGDMGFSIPSNTVRFVADQIKANHEVKRTWTGLRLQPLRDFDRDSFFEGEKGVLVASVDPDSPAEAAKLQVGDLIVAVDGQPIDGLYNENLPKIRSLLAQLKLNQPVEFKIERDGKPLVLQLTAKVKGTVEGEDLDLKQWNMTVKTINEHGDPQFYYYVKEGVFVQGVRYPGNAAEAGLAGGDILLKINGQEVKTLKDVRERYDAALKEAKGKKRVLFEVLRGGMPMMLVLDFTRDFDKE